MTASTLRSYSIKDLEQLAKRRGVNARGLRKDELVRAILRKVNGRAPSPATKKASVGAPPARRGVTAGGKGTPLKSKTNHHAAPRKSGSLGASVAKPSAQKAVAKNGAVVKSSAGKNTAAKVAAIKSAIAKSSAKLNGAAKQNGAAKLNGAAKASVLPPTKPSKPAVVVKQAPAAPPAPRAPSPQEQAQKARISAKIEQARLRASRSKNLAFGQVDESEASGKDRLVLMVRGPYWLHAYWDLTATGIARAQAALGQLWHQARPILRLLAVADTSSSTSERVLRDMSIHGGVKNWYIDVHEPAQTYRIEIGYLAPGGKFFSLARSNVVTTPSAAASDSLDAHWNDVLADCDKIYAMSGGFSTESSSDLQELFEERLRRPMGSGSNNRFGAAVDGLLPRDRRLRFHVDAEIVIHGQTQNDAVVTMQGEPLKLRPDGTFSVRLDMPNRRQVIPIIASTKDGVEQRTIVLAVERNTKVMEPLTRESTSE